MPYSKLSPYSSSVNISSDGAMVTANAEIGAVYLVLAGQAEVALADGASGMELKSGLRDGNTHVLVYSFDRGRTCTGEILQTSGRIISAEAADYNGNAYKVNLVPTQFAVTSYPNPFNPTATINMTLPVASDWSVTIFNVNGQKVAAYSGHGEAGTARVIWDASNQATGIYFYKVEAGRYTATRKLVLLK
jgi:hypothetical protein